VVVLPLPVAAHEGHTRVILCATHGMSGDAIPLSTSSRWALGFGRSYQTSSRGRFVPRSAGITHFGSVVHRGHASTADFQFGSCAGHVYI